MAGRPFTKTEDNTLLRLDAAGMDWNEVARHLPGRHAKALRKRFDTFFSHIPERPSGAASRPCLRCRETFDSDSPGNRICEPCGAVNARFRDFSGQPVHTADGPGLVFGSK